MAGGARWKLECWGEAGRSEASVDRSTSLTLYAQCDFQDLSTNKDSCAPGVLTTKVSHYGSHTHSLTPKVNTDAQKQPFCLDGCVGLKALTRSCSSASLAAGFPAVIRFGRIVLTPSLAHSLRAWRCCEESLRIWTCESV